MKIVVDAQLPYAAERFSALGDVEPLRADEMTTDALRAADALMVRSVTRVDRALLGGTGIRFVGSATSGTDHVDVAYLRSAGIAFADAAGCNSTAVAEYIAAVLLNLRARAELTLPGAVIGIVGCGHVGRKVARYAASLGCRVVINDPPLSRATCEPLYRPLDEIKECDVISLHVPLERGGTDPTYHLVDGAFLDSLRPGAILINTARGAVVDSAALKRCLRSGHLGASVLDVWENEPDIDCELFDLVTIGTAHIAGHTLDSKQRAVDMLFDAAVSKLCDRPEDLRATNGDSRLRGNDNGQTPTLPCHSREGWNLAASSGNGSHSNPMTSIEIPDRTDVLYAVQFALQSRFDITREAARLREVMTRTAARKRAAGFNALRAGHPARREFLATEVRIDANHPALNVLETLGFRVRVEAELPARTGSRA